MTEATLAGMKIEIAGHNDAHGHFGPAVYVVTNGSIYPISLESSAEQQAAARQWMARKIAALQDFIEQPVAPSGQDAAVQTAGLPVIAEQPVVVEVSDLDGVRCRLVCHEPGTHQACGSGETTDRRLLETNCGAGSSCAVGQTVPLENTTRP